MNKKQIRNLLGIPAKKFFNFGVVQNGSVDLMIYGTIGWEVDADELVTELKATTADTVNVYINSVGGDAFDGIAIYNALKNHPAQIVTCIEGLAASAASVIAMAGDEVQCGKSALLMIHNPSGLVMGESKDMRQTADVLDKLQGSLAQAYASKSGRPMADFLPLMDAETWFSADEAREAGLVDTVTDDEAEPAATEDALNMYNHVPDRLRIAARATKPKPSGLRGKTALRNAAAAAATKGVPVNLDDFKAFAAANPDAVAGYIDQGKKDGVASGQQSERDRVKAVAEACGENHALAVEAIVAGHSPDAVKLAAKAAAETKTKADAAAKVQADALAARDAEIATLKAQAEFNKGTQGPVSTRAGDQAAAPTGAAGVESQAKADWAANKDGCQDAYADEATFVRVAKRDAGVK